MFIVTPFTIAKMWKQPKHPSVDDWIKMWYIYNGILFCSEKEILPLATT